ncbi:MarR family winged helix-turn-helix transcriptional regulator [Kitasatospora sp. NPDC001540]|uniref:MarR family winged helix-turn-helix transcriptional regulator n=1 Tax=Kitasatospora sp. NPDC001540 TaxID=3364014 RepID=UPI0036942311
MDDPALTRLQSLPSWLLGRAGALAHRLVAERLAEAGLRMGHHAVLCALAEHGPLAQAELSRTVRIDPKDMVAALNELQSRALVTRERDPRDARKNLITLSPDGRTLLREAERLGERANADLTAPLTPAERDQLTALVRKLVTDR